MTQPSTVTHPNPGRRPARLLSGAAAALAALALALPGTAVGRPIVFRPAPGPHADRAAATSDPVAAPAIVVGALALGGIGVAHARRRTRRERPRWIHSTE